MFEMIRNNVVKITDDPKKRNKLLAEGYRLRDVPSGGGMNPPEAEPEQEALVNTEAEPEQEALANTEAELKQETTENSEQEEDKKPPRKGSKKE